MNIKKTFILVITLLAFASINLYAVPANVCNKKDLVNIIETQIGHYNQKKAKLEQLISGKVKEKFDISLLFTIDVFSRQQVNQYLKFQEKDHINFFEGIYKQCEDLRKELEPLVAKYEAVRSDVYELEKKFLLYTDDQKNIILNLTKQVTKSNHILEELKKEKQQALQEQYQALEVINKITEESSKGTNLDKSLFNAILEIENSRVKIAGESIELLQTYEDRFNHYQKLSEKLNNFIDIPVNIKERERLSSTYSQINDLWREIVDLGIRQKGLTVPGKLQLITISSNLNLSSNIIKDKWQIALSEDKNKLNQYYNHFIKIDQQMRQQLVRTHYQLIKNISNIRSRYLLLIKDHGIFEIINIDKEIFNDLMREFKIIPYRLIIFISNLWTDFKQNIFQGVSGYIELFKTIIIFVFVIIIPFFLFFIIKFFSKSLEHFRVKLVKSQKRSLWRIHFSLLVKNFSPYLPYVLAFIALEIIKVIITGSYFKELSVALPYFSMFLWYKIFITFFENNLKKIMVKSNLYTVLLYERKINRTAKIIGLFFLTALYILYTARITAGKAYIYFLVKNILYYLSIVVVFLATVAWRKEISKAAQNNFTNRILLGLAAVSEKLWGIILVIPLLVIIAVKKIGKSIGNRLFEFEIAKKTLARILRKQIEAAGAEIQDTDIDTLPEKYRHYFSLGVPKSDDVWIYPHTDDLKDTLGIIKRWINGTTDEISLALYGEKGIGKSSLLELVSQKIKESFPKISLINKVVPPKITTGEELIRFFEDLLDVKLDNNIELLADCDEKLSKTILFLDDAHNFFRAEVNGFNGFKTFQKLINLHLENLFICATFNIHSWIFLDGVFFKNRYFRNVIAMSPWNEEDISRLILERNEKAGIKLKYDPVISASLMSSEIESFSNIEKRFFRLLWEQSEGNPRAAIYTWLTCITPQKYYYKVGLPRDPESNIFDDIQFDALFIYASIVKHENITSDELKRVTEFSQSIIKYALKVGIERDFLYKGEDTRFRVNPAWHSVVVNFLKQRNLLYAN